MTSDIRDWTGVSGRSVRKPQTTGGGLHVCPHCHEPVDDTPATHEIPARYLANPGTRTHLTEDTVDLLARWCASCDRTPTPSECLTLISEPATGWSDS